MRKRQHRVFYLSRCAVCIALGSTFTHVAWARDYFNPAFIENHGQANRTSVDLSTFDNDKSQLPGTYYVTININKTEIGARNVDFQLATLSDGQQALQGCLRLQELKDNGVKTDLFPTLESEKGCVDLSVIPGASQRFDFQQQALSVSIPQLYIANNARGYVPPEKWQEGITALMLNYSFSGYKEYGSSEDSDDAESKYLALQPGFNLGPWRFRNYSNWSSNNGENGSWNSVYNYLQRDIIALKSQFTAGDSNTPSDVFDSVPFRGLQLTSDDQMQPNSQRGYAPTIRGITLYGGSQIAGDKYQSVAFGVGQNMQMLGAISLDGIWSHAKFDDGRKEIGQSWRVRYSKGVVSTGTTFSLAGYRYASENYNSLSEVINPDDDFYDNYGKRHNRFEASVNQQISNTLGSLTLSWVKEDYWHSAQQMESLSASYNNSWGPVSYTLSYSYNKNTYQYRSDNDDDDNDDDRYNQNDRLFTLSLHVPFTVFDSRLYASYMLNTRKHDATVNSTTLSGTALRDRNLNWSLQQSHSTQDGDSGGVNASYKGTYANLNAGYNQSPDSQQVSYGISGGILAHENGITLSQPITGAAILIKAPGASGVSVENQTGVATDFRGYTVIPNVTPYYRYDISLDSSTFADNVDIPLNNQTVYPTRNAVVRAAYDTHKGYRVLLTLTRSNGEPVPFGATASVDGQDANLASIVGDKGQVFLSGLPEEGLLLVNWGSASCRADYHLDISKNMNGIVMANAVCQ
ncbi:fimbria/pilus outer membrane usher protein [Salmonella enterica subsp. enterica serovar Oslo]|uniref:fimbria/pilus outer membrane usher protein n=1 Tax=Salmonella enterica TaxID=28901 RepID=UPI0009AC8E21|nr:fimbria/pilus outer membrane usher protein [Salmonella enterica]EAN4328029.1 fimbrial assembly protein [Salmonella enterica]EAN4769697.1 fimbrial assembly protein [Salmonella enterica]EAS5031259.1 fimbrial assembly protein [Salmonella enterica]EAT0343305.1 fimbrial assembly protein [Salmonella enterica]EAU4265720.1 fimbrial assembly protein [Salmonella enterica]